MDELPWEFLTRLQYDQTKESSILFILVVSERKIEQRIS